jgi:hypothetical protein
MQILKQLGRQRVKVVAPCFCIERTCVEKNTRGFYPTFTEIFERDATLDG